MSLARAARFPATSSSMIALAEHLDFAPSAILFLRLLGLHDVFENSIDFLNRCEEVKVFLRQERASLPVLLRRLER